MTTRPEITDTLSKNVHLQLDTVEVCPVCSSSKRQNLFVSEDWLHGGPGEFPLARCNQCGLVYLSKRPAAQSLSLYYPDDSYYAYRLPVQHTLFGRKDLLSSVWYMVRKSVLAHDYNYAHLGGSRLVARLLRFPLLQPIRVRAAFELHLHGVLLHPYVEDGSLLDIGCASGMYLDFMRALGWKRVVGVDTNAKAVQQARDVLGIEAYCGDISKLDLEPDSFDAVSLSHVLEHVPNPVEFLRAIRHLMKPGGRLGIIVPNVESLSARTFGEYWRGLEPPRHFTNFTRHSLALALNQAGFAVPQLTTTPHSGYHMAIISHSRKAGDPHAVYTDSTLRYPLQRRIRAFWLSLIERVQCAVGMPAGEALVAVAVKQKET